MEQGWGGHVCWEGAASTTGRSPGPVPSSMRAPCKWTHSPGFHELPASGGIRASLLAEMRPGVLHISGLLGSHSNLGEFLFDSFSRNPNGEGLPHWPVYDQNEGYLQIGVPSQAAQKLKDEEVAFWTDLWAKSSAREPLQTEHIEL